MDTDVETGSNARDVDVDDSAATGVGDVEESQGLLPDEPIREAPGARIDRSKSAARQAWEQDEARGAAAAGDETPLVQRRRVSTGSNAADADFDGYLGDDDEARSDDILDAEGADKSVFRRERDIKP